MGKRLYELPKVESPKRQETNHRVPEVKKTIKNPKIITEVSANIAHTENKEVLNNNTSFSIEKLAYAISMAETHNCKKGYGKMYNNCFGIKDGNTAPCQKIGDNKICIYEKSIDSYEAFYIIWEKWYGGFPNLKMAERWTGKDNSKTWLSNVSYFYNK